MKFLSRKKTPTEQLRTAATAVLNVVEDQVRSTANMRGLTGVRAVATGAAIYTAGLAAFKGRRFVREQISPRLEDDQAEELLRDESATEERGEPENEAYDFSEGVEGEEEPESREDEYERVAEGRGDHAGEGPPPSLELPRQRWARIPVGRQ